MLQTSFAPAGHYTDDIIYISIKIVNLFSVLIGHHNAATMLSSHIMVVGYNWVLYNGICGCDMYLRRNHFNEILLLVPVIATVNGFIYYNLIKLSPHEVLRLPNLYAERLSNRIPYLQAYSQNAIS